MNFFLILEIVALTSFSLQKISIKPIEHEVNKILIKIL